MKAVPPNAKATVNASARRNSRFTLAALGLAVATTTGACGTSGSAKGGGEKMSDEDQAKLKTIADKLEGTVVWSSSRIGNHDLFTSNADGSDIKALTKGDAVDWFPRFSPDGERILFVRSKKGWVAERDANAEGKWDLFSIPSSGGKAVKLVDNASWGTWVDGETILFVRGTKLFRKKLAEDEEVALVDSEKVPDLDGALLQQPEMSSDGRFVAITLRGSKRETGIWDLKTKTWTRTGDGCQINWTPDGKSVYWVHPTGNGGSRVFSQEMDGNKAAKEMSVEELTFIDLPGRRSHEYFPQLSADGKWMVWAATQRGHDHDTADYELYVWEVGTPATDAARLTFHSGNDRWPDIYIPGVAAETKTDGASTEGPATKAEGAEASAAEKVAANPTEEVAREASLVSAAAATKAKKSTAKATAKKYRKRAKKSRR